MAWEVQENGGSGADGRPVLSNHARCSCAPKEWLPIHHGFRTLRVPWFENQGLTRLVRNAGPDPSRKREHFLQSEIRGLTQQRMYRGKGVPAPAVTPRLANEHR